MRELGMGEGGKHESKAPSAPRLLRPTPLLGVISPPSSTSPCVHLRSCRVKGAHLKGFFTRRRFSAPNILNQALQLKPFSTALFLCGAN